MDVTQIKAYVHSLAEQVENSKNPQEQKRAKLLFHDLKQKHRKTLTNLLNDIETTNSKINKLSDKLTKFQNDNYVIKNKPHLLKKWIHAIKNWLGMRISINDLLTLIKKTPALDVSAISADTSYSLPKPPLPPSMKSKKKTPIDSPYKPSSPIPPPLHSHPDIVSIPSTPAQVCTKSPVITSPEDNTPQAPQRTTREKSAEKTTPKPIPPQKTFTRARALSVDSPLKIKTVAKETIQWNPSQHQRLAEEVRNLLNKANDPAPEKKLERAKSFTELADLRFTEQTM